MEFENHNLKASLLKADLCDTKYIYYVYQDILVNLCYYILITNENNEIIRIITPYAENYGFVKDTLSIHSVKCGICSDISKIVLHTVGDVYDYNKCIQSFPYNMYMYKFDDASKVLNLISSLYDGGNPGIWAGHSLRMDRDKDGELYGVYEDKETGDIYSGWVNTHRDRYEPVPRIIQLKQENDNIKENSTIEVLLEYDSENASEWIEAYKLSYKEHIAYTNRDFREDIYNRLRHLLLVN
jgi:hypothetical protein